MLLKPADTFLGLVSRDTFQYFVKLFIKIEFGTSGLTFDKTTLLIGVDICLTLTVRPLTSMPETRN